MKITTTVTGSTAKLYTPYNKDFVEKIKNAGGRWDADSKCWTVQTEALDLARAIMREVYGMDDATITETVRVRLTFGERVTEYGAGVTILGHTIAKAFGRDSGARVGDGVVFEAGKPRSGGSVKNWCSVVDEGSVVTLLAVPKAMLDRAELPSGVTMEIVPTAPVIDRAALVAERERLMARIAEIDKMLEK